MKNNAPQANSLKFTRSIQRSMNIVEYVWSAPEDLPGLLPKAPAITSLNVSTMLPDALLPWIKDTTNRLQVPMETLASSIICALSAVVGRKFGVNPRRNDDWTVKPILWGAIIARPGGKKSPLIDEAMRFLVSIEEDDRQLFLEDEKKLVA
jgi:putative DNA primase/helicase